jgi:excisionase family DNA binding protein
MLTKRNGSTAPADKSALTTTLARSTSRPSHDVIPYRQRLPVPAAPGVAEYEPPLTLPEAADHLGCSLATVRRRIAAGELIAVKHGRIRRVLPSDLRAFIRTSRRWR